MATMSGKRKNESNEATPKKQAVAGSSRDDDEDEMEVVPASSAKTGVSGESNMANEAGNRFMLMRSPYDNHRIFHIRGFKTVHHFVVDTFKHRYQTRPAPDISAPNNWMELIQLIPNYSFDTGDRGMYMQDRLINEIRRHCDPTINPQFGRNNCFIERAKGNVKLVGINAPFISSTTDQAATNSGVTLTAMVGKDLHERTKIWYGEMDITRSGSGLPTPTVLNINQNQYLADGSLNRLQYHTDWKTYRQFQIPKLTASTTVQVGDFNSQSTDTSYQWYRHVGCPSQIVPFTTKDSTQIEFPPISDMMHEIDLTESQGELFSWDEKCDSLLDFSDGIFNENQADVTIPLDHAVGAVFPKNTAAKADDIPVPTLATTTPSHLHPAYDGLDNFPTNPTYQSTLWYGKFLKSGNYIDFKGGDRLKEPKTMPVMHFFPINPPTMSTADGQHVVTQLILECEIDLRFEMDLRHPDVFISQDPATKSRTSIVRSLDPQHTVLPLGWNGGTRNGSLINPPSQKWGKVPLEWQ